MSSIYLYSLTFTLPTKTGLFDPSGSPSPGNPCSKTWYNLTNAVGMPNPISSGRVTNLSNPLTSLQGAQQMNSAPVFNVGDEIYVQVAPNTASSPVSPVSTLLTLVLAFGRANICTGVASPFSSNTFFCDGQMPTSGASGSFWVYYLEDLNNIARGQTWSFDMTVDVDTGSGHFGNDPEMVVTNG